MTMNMPLKNYSNICKLKKKKKNDTCNNHSFSRESSQTLQQ